MKTRLLLTVWVAGLLALAGSPALGQDRRALDRNIKWAEDAIKPERYEQGLQYLEKAQAELEKFDDAVKAEVQPKIDALRAQHLELKRASDEDSFVKRLGRQVGRELVERYVESGRYDSVERGIKNAEESLQGEEAKCLSAESRQECEALVAEAKSKMAKGKVDDLFEVVEKDLQVLTEILSGEDSRRMGWGDRFRQSHERALEGLEDCPSDDPRASKYAEQAAKSKAEFEELIAKLGKEETVGGVVKTWEDYAKGSYMQGTDGWESETPHTYEEWLGRSPMTLGLKKTQTVYGVVQRMLDDSRYAAAKKGYPEDPQVKQVVSDVEAMLEKCAGKACQAINALLDKAEEDQKTAPDRLISSLEQLQDFTERYSKGAQAHAATLARVKAELAKRKGAKEGAAEAKQVMLAKCKAAAEKAWPEMVSAFSDAGEIDPLACVESIGSWKGKRIHLEGFQNRAGWDYDGADYEFVATVSGTPVAGILDPGLASAIEEMEQKTGLTYEENDITDVIGVVEQLCRVQGIQYSQVFKKHLNTQVYKAPQLRIVAIRSGPFALALGQGTSLAQVEGLDDVDVTGSAGGGGGGGLVWLCLGFMCCTFFLAAVGGGGYYVYTQQAKAKAASGGAAGATPVTGPPATPAVGPAASPPPGPPAPPPGPPAPPPPAGPMAGGPPPPPPAPPG